MEDSWRFRKSQGNICPTCSNSHFPFCPQPPSFDSSFYKPYFDPISNNRGISHSLPPFDNRPNSIRPITGSPIDVYNDPINRIRSRFDYGGSDFASGEFVENDRIIKRMRIGEMASQLPPIVGTRLSAEDERRLSLIREHGTPSSVPPPQIGVDSKIGMGSGYVSQGGNRLNGYSHDTSFGDWQPRPPGNSFYDPMSGSADRVMQSYEFGRWEHASGYDHQKLLSSMDDFRSDKEGSGNEPWPRPHYGQNDNSVHSSIHSYGPANALVGAPNYANTSRSCQEGSPALVREEESQQPHISRHVPYDSHQLQAKGFYQSEFSHVVNSPLSSGSGVLIYENKQNFHIHNDVRRPFEVKVDDFQTSVGPHNSLMVEQYGGPKISEQETYLPISTGNSLASIRQVQGPTYGASGIYPPLPLLPPPSLPMEPPGPPPTFLQARASPPTIPIASSDVVSLLHPSALEGQLFPPKNPSPDKPKIIDASSLFKRPYRDTRPDHIVAILRGLPGSGKSYLAKMLRDLEVDSGANAPRIHSMDDYFMTEVEKVEESDVSKSSGSAKGKKRVTKKVMEYCYEPEMEEAYRSSMLKAFKKTVEDGTFTFIIVDDRNLRVADFAQFWASAKSCGYEVYLLEAMYKDPVGCAARNIHGFSSDDIQKMAELWEEAPSLYLRLDIQSLFHGDDLKEHGIQEVDMDMDDVACDESQSGLQNKNSPKTMEPPQANHASDDSVKEEERWDAEGDDPGVKELGRSKWSHDADDEDIERSESAKRAPNALSGLIQAYTKGDKSVHWGDQVGKSGFSIGSSMRAKVSSLVIGPGAGYNLKSNPLPEEENEGSTDTSWQSNKRTVFEEHLRAERASERESFKAVTDKRRQRIRGLEMEDQLQ